MRPTALAAQVVERLHAHTEPDSQLRERERGLDRVLMTNSVGGGLSGLACKVGVHTKQVHEAPRGPPRPAERRPGYAEAEIQSAD